MTEFDYERLYAPENSDEEHDAIDYLYQTASAIMREGDYERIGRAMRDVAFDRLSTTMQVGFLTITLSHSSVIPGRHDFYMKVHDRCVRDGEDPERLLHGLERGGPSAAWGHNTLNALLGISGPKAPG